MNFKAAESLSGQIAQHLGEKIITGELQPKQRIQELAVAKDLQVSRGSVREALLILEGRHLIDIIPRRGAIVSELSTDHVCNLYEIITNLQTLLAQKLARYWKGSDLAPFNEKLQIMQHLANKGQVNDFIKEGFDFIRLAYPLANNHYLEAILEDLQPTLHRTYYHIFKTKNSEMQEQLSFFDQLLETVFKRQEEALPELIQEQNTRQKNIILETWMY